MQSSQASRRSVEAPFPNVRGAAIGGAFSNRTFNELNTAPTPTTAGMALIPMAMKLQARASGVFFVSFSIAYTGWMATETTSITIQSLTAAAGTMTFANSVLVGPPGQTTVAFGATALPGSRVSTAAAGIVITGGAGSLTQVATGTLVQGTAATTFVYSWSGLLPNTVTWSAVTPTAEGGFTPLNEVVVTFTINHQTTAGAIATGAATMAMYELP